MRMTVIIGLSLLILLSYESAYAINITANFSKEMGDVKDNMYGVNTHSNWFDESSYTIDSSGDGSYDTDTNSTWHSNAFLNSKMDTMRWDMYLSGYYKDDGADYFTRSSTSVSRIAGIKWANENDIKVILIASYMPSFLADTTKNCSANIGRCPPKNATVWAELVVDYIDWITSEGLYNETVIIEIWNEPEIAFWMPDLADDHILKFAEYNIMYNETYDVIKATYPNIEVGGYAATATTYANFPSGFFSSVGNKIDYFSFHRYSVPDYATDFTNAFAQDMSNVINDCATGGVDCSNLILSEWNIGHGTEGKLIRNTTSRADEYGMYIAEGYSWILNNYPENISMQLYQWAEQKKYLPSIGYDAYPHKWTIVSEPNLDDEYSPPYNVTKNFATYHKTGSTVYKSTSTNDTIKTTATKKGDMTVISVINTNNCTVDINLTLEGLVLANLKNVEDNTVYTITDYKTELGTFSAYEIKYLVNDAEKPDITIKSLANTTYYTRRLTYDLWLDEEGVVCYYSDGGGSNQSISGTGVNYKFSYSNTSMTEAQHTVEFYCNDTFGNWNNTDITFTNDNSCYYGGSGTYDIDMSLNCPDIFGVESTGSDSTLLSNSGSATLKDFKLSTAEIVLNNAEDQTLVIGDNVTIII